MLSAVAARKARLQEKGETSTPSTPTSFNSSSTNANSEGKTLASSKRKHSPGESAKLVKRKRKGPPRVLEAKQTRYFEKIPDTILLIDSDREEQGSDVETSSESSDDVPLEPSSSRRMWSPSRPVMGAPGVISDHNAIGRNSTNTPSGSSGPFSIPLRLSTYEPTLNENFYSLTEEETITLLGPTSARDGTSCVLILLSASEKVALFGTYTLVLLRGRVSLAGVSMKASKTPHTVFSNRSSPIPIIECVASDETHSDSSDIPPRCLSAVDSHGVVMLVHRLHSGIEGLGLVCRTFENAFVPPKWSTTETLTDGIHLVSDDASKLGNDNADLTR